ncbi:MAG: GGDEF domain-containing protein [bacterium]
MHITKNYLNSVFDILILTFIINTLYIYKILSEKKKLKNQIDSEFLRASKAGVMSITDPLTGAYNRRHFDAVLDRIYEESKNQNTDFSLMIIDIDHFKRFNDTYGHDIGDIVLKTVVDTIKNNIRKNLDMFFRFGGEEFVIITSDKKDGAVKLANKLNGLDYNHIEKITISIGVAFYQKGILKEELIKTADTNLYKAKEQGRNKVVYEDN